MATPQQPGAELGFTEFIVLEPAAAADAVLEAVASDVLPALRAT